METKKNDAMIASIENVEAIRDFFKRWWTSAEMYETAAKACSTLMYLSGKGFIVNEDMVNLSNFMEQHVMLINLIKPFEKEDAE